MTLHCIYSISDNSYPKERFSFATKQYCLTNFVQRFGLYSKIHLLVDNTNLKQETRDFANQISVDTEYYDGGSSAASWRKAVDYILKNVPNGIKNSSEFIKADAPRQYRILEEALKNTTDGLDKKLIQQTMDKIAPYAQKASGINVPWSELHPNLVKAGKITKNLIKGTGVAGGILAGYEGLKGMINPK